jgi:hypothetical protein
MDAVNRFFCFFCLFRHGSEEKGRPEPSMTNGLAQAEGKGKGVFQAENPYNF